MGKRKIGKVDGRSMNFTFDANTTQWSDVNALWSAKASALAYSDREVIESTVSEWGFSKFEFLERKATDTQSFVVSNQEMILVVFRGTEPDQLRDWMTDADIHLSDSPMGMVHHGFLGALTSIWDDLLFAINEQQTHAQSVWLTGHSLGAALAGLATAKLRLELDKPVNGLYTFGQPRVGDRDFARHFNADFKPRAFRYVNNADVVTRVPPRSFGYSHVGTFVFFDEEGAVQSDLHWWNKFLEEVEGDIEGFLTGKLAPLEDHKIENYVARLEKNLGKNPF